ncbi:MAG TPA: ThuA domain-containing protein [Bacteroidales bacterium]|nr:ThuA domain-containing protein [Bacteroidales bacterium]
MKRVLNILLIISIILLIFTDCKKSPHYRALIITGQNSTDWVASTPVLKQILEKTGIFECSILISPTPGGEWDKFRPAWDKYNLVVLNYNGEKWPETIRNGFISYVNNGGGVLVYHSASIAFPDWKEYNEICGISGWDNRSEKDGPYIYFRGNRMVLDSSAGPAGWHGEPREFEVRIRNTEHPVTRGLPVRWMHAKDLLYARLRGPAKNMEVLATAYCDTTGGGTGRDEPVMMAITYGKGRVFHTTLGFPGDGTSPALQCAGFITTLQRGAEWAASGKVTQPVPRDFPTVSGVVLRTEMKPITLKEEIENLAKYEIGMSTRYYKGLQDRIRKAAGDPDKLLEIEKMMVKLLENDKATIESKKLVLRELSWMGTDYCIPTIKKLQENAELKDEVDFALERLGVK